MKLRLMAKKPAKFVLDTSVSMVAIGGSTPNHNVYFNEIVENGTLFVSVYVRMEFIRRWICTLIKNAMISDQSSSVKQALHYIEQDFSSRSVKVTLSALAEYWVNFSNASSAAELAEEFAHASVLLLKRFDETLTAKINNGSECQVGARPLKVDFNTLMSDLRDFYSEFTEEVLDCGVNDFVDMQDRRSRATRILDDKRSIKCTSAKNLDSIRSSENPITCKNCSTIGDVVIALEQPSKSHLLHTDRSFIEYCRVLGKPETYVESVAAVEKAQLKPNFGGDPPAAHKLS